MKNKFVLFVWGLIQLPFRIIFTVIGILIMILSALFLGIIGKKNQKN